MPAEYDTEDAVLSGEAVAIDVQPVGFLLRALGALIDVLVSALLLAALVLLQNWLAAVGVLDEATQRIMVIASIVLCFVVVPIAVEASTHGRSLGKLAVGGRIVRVDGGATGFRHAFIRALTGVFEIYMTLGAVAVIAGVFSARSQRVGDLIAGTYSQRVRTPRLVVHHPELPPVLTGWASVADVARLPDRLARRISQFLATADHLAPAARTAVAADLASQARPYVSPDPGVDAETALRGITALRRGRESRALAIADARADHLTRQHLGV